MGAIFLSHSSHDSSATAELKERLQAWGYGSVFLDFDPEQGIPPGRDWERELYHQLRTCHAVLVLCSRHSMASYWCFAEITHARSLGKHVFPLRIAECDIHPVLSGQQVLDLSGGDEEAYRQLERALKDVLGEGFPWDKSRAPYPGLIAFQKEDAAVFFGREDEIQAGLEDLERLRRYGAGRALMVLGASGSGKSSLVRAGLLPRLSRDSRRWLVLKPFRPLDRPWRELARCLAGAFRDHGQERDRRELQKELERSASGAVPSAGALVEILRELQLTSGHEDAKVLLTLDQTEELLTEKNEGPQARFAPLLQAALTTPRSPLMVIGTLRSDLLAEFQKHPATRSLVFDDLRLGPMSSDGLMDVIEGPARLAEVDLEDGLADAILADTDPENPLPLLAFALRELYERFGADRKLTLEEYRDGLGGLGGSVAQAAESVLREKPLSGDQERLVREALLALARVDEEGHYARRRVRLPDLKKDVHALIQAFARARLLVIRGSGERQVVEVAHETLFRSWDRLRAWLDEDREFLLWRRRLDASAQEWQRTGRHASALLEGPALEEGRRWLEQRGSQLEPGQREFLKASVRRATVRRARLVASAGLAATLLTLVAVGGVWLWRRAETQRARAVDAARVALAGELMDSDPTRAAQVLLEVRDPETASFAVARMREALGHRLAESELIGHRGKITAAAFSPDGSRLVTASVDETARIWRADGSGESVELAGHDEEVTAASFSPDGKRVLTVTRDGVVRVWPVAGTAEPLTMTNPPQGLVTSFDSSGRRVLTVTRSGRARVWRTDGGGEQPLILGDAEHFIIAAAFNPAGDRLVTVAKNGDVYSWESDRPGEGREIGRTDGEVDLVELSPLGDRLLTVGEDGVPRVRRLNDMGKSRELAGLDEPLLLARFSRFGERLLSVSESGQVWIWDLATESSPRILDILPDRIVSAVFGPEADRILLVTESGSAWLWSEAGDLEVLLGHSGHVEVAGFSPTGDLLVTAADDGSARIWRWRRPEIGTVLRGHTAPLVTAVFSPDGARILTASLDGTAKIWPTIGGEPDRTLRHDGPLYKAEFEANGERVLTLCEDEKVRLWRIDDESDPLVLADTEGIETAALDPREPRVAFTSFSNQVKVWTAGTDEALACGSHAGPVLSVAFAPDGRHVVTTSTDGTATIWNLDTPGESVPLVGHEQQIQKAVFSPDGRRVVTGSDDHTARVWNADGSGEPIVLRGHKHYVVAVSFGPDGRRVLTGSNDNEVRIWDLDQPDDPIVLSRHSERITKASFSADGRFVVSASSDGKAMVWRADGSGEPVVLAGHADSDGEPARVTAAVFSPDGEYVLTGAEDSTARLWLISAGGLRREIASTVNACLEPEFRRSYLGESLDQARLAREKCQLGSSARGSSGRISSTGGSSTGSSSGR